MCGIIAYSGHRPAVPVIIQGLKSLEYRGYDSSGLAFVHLNRIHLFRASGKLEALEARLDSGHVIHATSGIGHTRWATHGLPNEQNAHPHLDVNSDLALVHNGIIENFQELKDMLSGQGCTFRSETDTEVLVCLISFGLSQKGDLRQAVSWALSQVEGSYAFAMISRHHPGTVWAARQASPLIFGLGTGENFIASDIPAFLPFTRDVVFLEDNELVEMTPEKWTVFNARTLEPIEKKTQTISWDVQAARKGGYKHFMLKEIFEQPKVIRDCLAGRIQRHKNSISLPEIKDLPIPSRLHIIACGTSYHAGLWGKYLLEALAGIPVDVEIASEFRYKPLVPEKDKVYLTISQSGETADTLAALRLVREHGFPVLGLCNVVGSSLAREADHVIYTQAGPEISVASTKAMCSQLVLIFLLALYWAEKKRLLTGKDLENAITTLLSLPEALELELPDMRDRAASICKEYSNAQSFFFLGRGLFYPLALEGALKLKEISYIHAEGYAAGELKHGPIALIDPEFPTFAIAPCDGLLGKVKSNLKEIQARKGRIIALTQPGSGLMVDNEWKIPGQEGPASTFFILPALQLFAYETAVYLGKDVDQPRNLAKSVTVE
ncbi:glutamine--fructose-6-phosphate transaminase (isomerizing) [Desulfonatronovibrio hydrogenovorans]|uniref:glutamine--fructose-6-phosphate transaminase (isomerizing) n=1 Tax=Desulfonatronovibrio hydrogenovorans TaxID=53245 RepID=UPI00048D0166|nr:glutamine--fructose-6-phosphate transaminase (isomerizing) [Desulfonatronovibrio hydrogenovorans]